MVPLQHDLIIHTKMYSINKLFHTISLLYIYEIFHFRRSLQNLFDCFTSTETKLFSINFL